MSVRERLLAAVEAAVGSTAHVIPYQDAMDVPDRVTVMFKQTRVTPIPEAPRSGYVVHYVLTVVSPALDPSIAEAELDEFVPSMLGDLDHLDWFAWSTADKVLAGGLMAYDVECWNLAYEVPTRKAAPPAPPKPTRKRAATAPSTKEASHG